MAKKHARSGKPTPGGRVTPKGTRPDGADRHDLAGPATEGVLGHRPAPLRIDATSSARVGRSGAPTRAGHHRGQR